MYDKIPTLGIMSNFSGLAPTFQEKEFYKKLSMIGRRSGIGVFVFSPLQVDFNTRTVTGYFLKHDEWQKGSFPLPDVIYDRCFISPGYRQYKPFIEKLQSDPQITFMSNGLAGKWQVYKILALSPELSRLLPDTQPFTWKSFAAKLRSEKAVIVKPASGTHGNGVIRITRKKGSFEVIGRKRNNSPMQKKIHSWKNLHEFLIHFIADRPFILQTYLDLNTPDGAPFDVRVLVQKNGEGKWQTTGKAVRMGEKKSITSNLHGGGRALPFVPFLEKYFSRKQQVRIMAEIDRVAELLPGFLETYHGRLAELGIDLGVDQEGRIWIIEVNSRPGRYVFRQIDDQTARLRSLTQPVEYAQYLMKDRVGGY
ncbi:YheC/YheD family protein [Brevibacillus massiliensis]|jgi:hypothetical protein|uniref:YheC/YheD family endospore coat-associated protein n=1 Tax=Brevibacillus massiliensis TaxID=1118054 RepID=UPI0002EFA749|nr:YheC/YheD family protein [Brevibacillus massiliensis]